MSALSLVSPQPGLEAVSDLSADALDYGRAALSENTMRAYRGDWQEFEAWCAVRQRSHLPASPATVANYASSLASAGKKVPTIARKLAAIRFFHRGAGEENPTDNAGVAAILKGIRRTVGTAPRQKAPATVDVIHALLARIDADTLQGKRDRALLLLGFAGAFRRSELVAITVEDLTFSDEGVDVFLPKSKTDQEAKGQSVAVLNGKALKPTDRLKEWLSAAEITSGPIFRRINRGDHLTDEPLSAQSVALIVKKYADAAGLDVEKLSGHSLRAGFVTSAAENRASISRIMEVTRHRDPRTVETYVRRADRFKDHAGDGFL
ncbi:site-specific integrase [Neorhizobium petrolearium]|uniref:Site-specific integrase n=1 Tax=Neorhizobium petrolearium TaxID=515361 RepID=A0ABY8LZL5_9HYPH|nr:site-specific integrase [Neorhizobium petrolearium]MCC2612644.1 tyrosine-type recombinase/integrase [Neorhizobium petrolearium]WGI67768.1 site-specific integrase [Neorhizobium petrolearium]